MASSGGRSGARAQFPSATGVFASETDETPPPTETLRALAVFAGLTDEGLEQLAVLGKFYDAAPRDLVARKGDPCDAVYFILSGELRVRLVVGVVDQDDKTLCKLSAGEFFGELGSSSKASEHRMSLRRRKADCFA